MNTEEARKILDEIILEFRKLSYEELLRFQHEPDNREITGDSGALYQVETIVFLDNPKNRTLRVAVAVFYGGGWREIFPLTDDFIIAPDGSYVGE